jgi:hypothetical protein
MESKNMTIQNDEIPIQSIKSDKAREAYIVGKICAGIRMAKDDLVMDKPKEALSKLNEIIKFLEIEVVPEYYKPNEPIEDAV